MHFALCVLLLQLRLIQEIEYVKIAYSLNSSCSFERSADSKKQTSCNVPQNYFDLVQGDFVGMPFKKSIE